MDPIIFNARLKNTGRRIKSLSGRLGPFIFRTYQNGLITAFYKPKKAARTEANPSHNRADFESLSSQLREIAYMCALQITSIDTNLPQS